MAANKPAATNAGPAAMLRSDMTGECSSASAQFLQPRKKTRIPTNTRNAAIQNPL